MDDADFLELHYLLRDDAHSMDAVVRNKCEAELLAVFGEVARLLKVNVRIETTAYTEGGLKELWKAIGANKDQLGWIIAVVALVLTRIPVGDKETDTYSREVARLTVEEKKLTIEKLKRELDQGKPPKPAVVEQTTSAIEGNLKVIARRSNFYKLLLKYDKVTGVGFTPQAKDDERFESQVLRQDFFRFVLLTDKLPVEIIQEAPVEIVAPVLREGNYEWKGLYDGNPISFKMADEEFKDSVLRGEVSFQHGTTIQGVLNVHRKFDELGEILITGYTMPTVISKSDGGTLVETPQGGRHRHDKKLAENQGQLFGGLV